MAVTNTREPDSLVAGDTITFIRSLPGYLASAGWSLLYEIRGGAQAIEFESVASGDDHVVTVAADVTAGWLPGNFVLAGYAVLESTGERHQIYYSTFPLFPNLPVDADAPVTTHAQRMVTLLEARLEEMAQHVLDDSKVQESEFHRAKRTELKELLDRYKMDLRGEQNAQDVANGRPNKNKIKPFFNVTGSAFGISIR